MLAAVTFFIFIPFGEGCKTVFLTRPDAPDGLSLLPSPRDTPVPGTFPSRLCNSRLGNIPLPTPGVLRAGPARGERFVPRSSATREACAGKPTEPPGKRRAQSAGCLLPSLGASRAPAARRAGAISKTSREITKCSEILKICPAD